MDLRDSILDGNDSSISDPIPCPEWGKDCVLHVRTMTGEERDAFEESCLQKKGKSREFSMANVRAKLVCLAACDADGKPVFRRGDEIKLGKKSAKVLDRLFAAAQQMNGISDADAEDLAKNSGSGPNAASGLS